METRELDLARLAAVQRVLDGAEAVAETLRSALERLEPELDVLRGEIAALAVAQVEARRCACRWEDASYPTACERCSGPMTPAELDAEVRRERTADVARSYPLGVGK